LPLRPSGPQAALPVHDLVERPADQAGRSMKIHVTDLEGAETAVEAKLSWTVMEIIRDGDLTMRAECGGSCACATCHVYVAPDWVAKLPAQESEERDTLEGGTDTQPNSRLACQLIMTTELDGLRVTVSKDAAG